MNEAELRRGMGYVIQHAGLFPHRTVLDNIGTVPRLLGWDKKQTARRARGAARAGRPGPRARRALPRPALRWPAAARRRRPGARGRPAGDAHGRAVLGRRPGRARAAAGRVPAPAGRARQDHRLRHPRHRRGDQARRPGRGAARRRPRSPRWPSRPTCSPTRPTTSSPTSSGRDRGYRALGFQEAPRLPLHSEPTVRARRTPRPHGCRVAPRGRRRPASAGLGRARRASATAQVAEADLHRGGTVAREHGSLRAALDCRAVVAEPSRASSSTTAGCCAARCSRARGAQRHRDHRAARARRVRPGARRRGRGARRRGRAVTWLADNWRHGADAHLAQPLPRGHPARHRVRRVHPAGLGGEPLVAHLPGDHHDDRAALHDPVAGPVRHHAGAAGHQDPRPGQRRSSP